MSHNITLEELLNQLSQDHSSNPYQERYRQYQQQQQRQQQRAAAALATERQRQAAALQRQREEAAARAYASSFANHPLFNNGFYYQDDDEDEIEEPAYSNYFQPQQQQQRYPSYYHPFFQPVQGPPSPVAGPTPPAPIVRRKYPKQDQLEDDNSFDLTELLNYLIGGPETQKKEESVDTEQKPEVSKAGLDSKVPAKPTQTKPAETKPTPVSAPSSASKGSESKKESKPAFVPHLKRHTTFTEEVEPEPKIEISTRNFKNENLPYSPQTNVYDLPNEYVAILAIPGASLKDLHIDFHAATNEVVVKGEVPTPFATDKLKQIKNLEIRSGSIERRIKFPNLPKINDDDIKANYLNGLLTVKIPKKKDDGLVKAKRKVIIEDVPDEELVYESNPDNFVKRS